MRNVNNDNIKWIVSTRNFQVILKIIYNMKKKMIEVGSYKAE